MTSRFISKATARTLTLCVAVLLAAPAGSHAGIGGFSSRFGATNATSGCPRPGGCTCGGVTTSDGCACQFFCACPSVTDQPPFDGPIWRGSEGKPPAVVFSSLNVRLLSWIPVTQFDTTLDRK